MVKIAPSILAADFACLGEEARRAADAGVDWIHLDVMDGHFVPNLTMGPDVVAAVKRSTDLFRDTHLMVTNPENFFEPFAAAGSQLLTFHIEVAPDPREWIETVHTMGCKAGLSLNPDCDVERVLPFVELVELVLVMSVFPGFGGQSFIPESLDKIRTLRDHIDRQNLNCLIEVDGGINRKTAGDVISAGADVLVMGTAFYRDDNPEELVRSLKAAGG